MNNLLEPGAAEALTSRLQKIAPDARPAWGKMNAAQMMAHCQMPFRVYFGEEKLGTSLIGFLFGPMAKRKLFSDKPWPHNLPTAKSFVVIDERNLQTERAQLLQWIGRFAKEAQTVTPQRHPFFGKLSTAEWGMLAYKHLDHHLQQFGV